MLNIIGFSNFGTRVNNLIIEKVIQVVAYIRISNLKDCFLNDNVLVIISFNRIVLNNQKMFQVLNNKDLGFDTTVKEVVLDNEKPVINKKIVITNRKKVNIKP